MIEPGIDPEPAKSRENVQTDTLPEERAPIVSNDQTSRVSIQSTGSIYSVNTIPSQHSVEQEFRANSPRPRLGQPITASVTLSFSASNSKGSLTDVPKLLPGLTVSPSKPPRRAPAMARLLVPRSRWSVTTASSDPSTPAPVSATGFHLPNQSRWSFSTTTTNTTFASGGRFSEVPLMPALPRYKAPSSGK
jgi:hypothetical protein